MSISIINKTAVNEAKNVFYRTCDTGRLSDKDLLILILAPLVKKRPLSEVADDILQKGLSNLATLSEFELSTLFGLDEIQSLHLMSVFEIGRRMKAVNQDEEIIVRSPRDIERLLWDLPNFDRENFVCIFLNTKNKVIGRETIAVGTLNACLIHPREVFKAAIRRGAASIVVAHNHPSGDPTASFEDIQMTRRLVEAGELIGIEVLDHVIIGHHGKFESLKEKGNM